MTPEESPATAMVHQAAKLRRLQFAEVLGWALVIAFAVLVVSYVLAAVLTANIATAGLNSGHSTATVLFTATNWVGHPEVALILLGAVGLSWWQVASLGEGEDDSNIEDVPHAQRIRHLARMNAIATAAGALLVITIMAAVGYVVGSWVVFGSEPRSAEWGERVGFIGEGSATCLLCLGGLFGVYLLRRQIRDRIWGDDDLHEDRDAD